MLREDEDLPETDREREMRINESEYLTGMSIIKIPQTSSSAVFVTDKFVKRVRSARLKGFWFPLVWSSD